jgi:hypothetical protein
LGVGTETDHTPPSYDWQSYTYVLRKSEDSTFIVENLADFSEWPTANEMGLDKRQYEALYTALTSRVALIQGPPGTGKTFLALRIIQSLLDNKNSWQGQNEGELLAKSEISESGASCRVNWRVKNKIFWENYFGEWCDDRAPIVVICLTVRDIRS